MFKISANTFYSIDENGKHSLEISYQDSEGVNVGAYSEGDSFENVIVDAIDQLDEAVAKQDDDRADIEEAENLQKQIAELQAQIDELQIRNNELEKRRIEREQNSTDFSKKVLDFEKIFSNFYENRDKNKVNDFPFAPKWWA